MDSRSVVVLELNELCPPLLDRFISAGDLPNFARLRDESVVYVTDAGEAQEHLNPWIQWVTAHTGAAYEEHGIFKLGEGALLEIPTVADLVGRAGGTVWLCGPMNVVPTAPVRGQWLPDPWNPDDHAVPAELAPFARFVRANVQEHTNPAHRLSFLAQLRFGAFMLRHGLSFATLRAAAVQLAGERVGLRERWRRAALLDRFQWDLFRHELRALRPSFATYFSNTTAHYQHLYWRYMDPAPFDLKPSADDVRRFGEAVRFGYLEMDRIVGDALALTGDASALVLCTALSQQPYLSKDEAGGSRFYRPTDIGGLVARLGVRRVVKVSPVMSEQFHLYFASEDDAETAATILSSASVANVAAFSVRRVGADVFAGFAPKQDLPPDAEILVAATGARVAVAAELYRSETPKSGYHHPAGAFWVRRPLAAGAGDGGVVSLRAVAPTLLDLMGLRPPPSMRESAIPAGPSLG